MKLVGRNGFVLTEAGFGSDIGMEKFFNIKCRTSQKIPNAVVLVCTVRALKMHGGGPTVTAGAPLRKEYTTENLDLLQKGLPNLIKHIENGLKFDVPVVVAINAHISDTDAEHQMIINASKESGAFDCVISNHYCEGGLGAIELAKKLAIACEKKSDFKFLYELDLPILEKITIISREMYGAGSVEMTQKVKDAIKLYSEKVLV